MLILKDVLHQASQQKSLEASISAIKLRLRELHKSNDKGQIIKTTKKL